MAENIFLFVPNLIGYARIVLALLSFYYMKDDYLKAIIFYFLSVFLDAFDGYAARILDQSTRFGSILDQLTDRVGTMCLTMILGLLYPEYIFLFQISNMIDIAGHWIHIWVGLLKGKSSHKYIDPSENPVLRLYYTSRPVLFFMCSANELFYISLYLVYFTEGPFVTFAGQGLFRLLVKVCGPLALLKHIITLIQVVAACMNIAALDVSERDVARQSTEKNK
ncbi:CDP-diacylglycerol--inositol 3-phosphatidyltransferase-like [Brevipalpus obovatus]|uniref:CDP-diacylglycerol--inositol 3-phosphatidyltransferase-like n=1 Tax=Brevipalpus obovatus TaxID=246614 RepID=UPI003D9DD508